MYWYRWIIKKTKMIISWFLHIFINKIPHDGIITINKHIYGCLTFFFIKGYQKCNKKWTCRTFISLCFTEIEMNFMISILWKLRFFIWFRRFLLIKIWIFKKIRKNIPINIKSFYEIIRFTENSNDLNFFKSIRIYLI